jgi:acyl carrier protein
MSNVQAENVALTLRGLVGERVPASWRYQAIPDDLPLGNDGIGLDSISLVELLLDCEAALSLPFPAAVFDHGPLTLRRLIEHAQRAQARLAS